MNVFVSATEFVRERFVGGDVESLETGSGRLRFKDAFFLAAEVRTSFGTLESGGGGSRFAGTRCLVDLRNTGWTAASGKAYEI